MQIIPRENYAAWIDAWIGKEQIVVLTGQRRVGKSGLAQLYRGR